MHSRPLLYKFLAVRRIPLKKYFNSLPIACHPERSEHRGYVNMEGGLITAILKATKTLRGGRSL